MKKILVTMLAFGAISLTANAQQPTPPANPPQANQPAKPRLSKEQREEMKKQREVDLANAMTAAQLTDAQKADTKAALDSMNQKMKEMRKEGIDSKDELKEQRKLMEKELKEKLIKIMGEEKYKKFKEAQKAAKEAREKNAIPQ